jgi:regulator of cell morphogenesis and NO signaling
MKLTASATNDKPMNSQTITTETTVGEIVRAVPGRSRVFENLGIDYCCGGKKPLAEVCRAKGLDPATVVTMLAALDAKAEVQPANPDAMTLTELCDNIEQTHHGYLREELPRLDFMTRKVAAVHGDHEPRLLEVQRVFENFNTEIGTHIQEEDDQIFPAIRQLESNPSEKAKAVATLRDSFEKLESEHESAGGALVCFKELTDNYTPPEWACNTFRALYDGLAQLEKNMHQHVHKENNVLFPKVLAVA